MWSLDSPTHRWVGWYMPTLWVLSPQITFHSVSNVGGRPRSLGMSTRTDLYKILIMLKTFWCWHLFFILKKCSNIFLPHATDRLSQTPPFILTHFGDVYFGWPPCPKILKGLLQIWFLGQVSYILAPSDLTCIGHASDSPFLIYWKWFFSPAIAILRHFSKNDISRTLP